MHGRGEGKGKTDPGKREVEKLGGRGVGDRVRGGRGGDRDRERGGFGGGEGD